jgi:hypothetical protein
MKEVYDKPCGTNRLVALAGMLALTLNACGGGGGGGGSSQSTMYNLQAGYGTLVTDGLTTGVNLSGTVTTNGVSVAFTGTGTLTVAPGAATTFDGASALSQNETLAGTVTADGESAPYSTNATFYYATGTYDLLGETTQATATTSGVYAVAPTPIAYPDSIVGGSNGTLGTINTYTDSTMSTLLETSQLTYAATAPVDPGSPLRPTSQPMP